eukprot:scaffold21543_cov145-Skeletonema_menzelii.AAC.2
MALMATENRDDFNAQQKTEKIEIMVKSSSQSSSPTPSALLKSPFLTPRRVSSRSSLLSSNRSRQSLLGSDYGGGDYDDEDVLLVEPEHKSNLVGCTSNLITAIIGAGIIGVPYAMRQSGLVAGWFLILLSATLGIKSLTMLVETAKHVDVQSYELLCEAVFGQVGWIGCNIMMFFMSYGPMLSYMILVKDTLGTVLTVDSNTALVVSSVLVMLPLCLQRDVADLAKTSRVSVLFDVGLVFIIAKYSPISETAEAAGGIEAVISNSIFRPRTVFIGLGILSFAFSCQHSSLIIAGSLDNPTRERWTKVSRAALGFCAALGIIMGTCGYLGFTEQTDGNILNNFAIPTEDDNSYNTARAPNVARALLCCTMFCVFPLEHFVARHVIMTNLFRGRQAHEGDDHSVLDRWDRRAVITIILFSSCLLSALNYDDVGLVLAWTGTVAATTLSYIVPGMLYLGVNGQDYLDFVKDRWGFASTFDDSDVSWYQRLLWYSSLMPVWCGIASMGSRGVADHEAKKVLMSPTEFRLGKIIHKRKMYDALPTTSASTNESQLDFVLNDAIDIEVDAEEDPLDEEKSATDFMVAIFFILFGVLAFGAGVFSICTES